MDDAVLHKSWWPVLVAGGLWMGAFLWLRGISVSHDVVWQMWIARQLSNGSHLYRDILEINPPLWFWMAVPVQWAAEILQVAPTRALVGAVFVQIGAALLILSRLLEHQSAGQRALTLVAALAAMAVIPIPVFGQREHLALVAAIPYVALAARRADGKPVPWPLALATGALAAPGFALKHYFVLVPIFLEFWLIARRRADWRPVRPETLALAGAAVLYTVSVLLFAPNFLADIVPMVTAAYHGYERPALFWIVRPWSLSWVVAVLALWRERHLGGSLLTALAIAAAAFAISYALQQKGWRYHAMPATALLFFACAVALPMVGPDWRTVSKRPLAVGTALLILIQSLVAGPYVNGRAPDTEVLLHSAEPGSAVLMLTSNPSNIWPSVEQMGFVWPSRHFTFWMLNAMAAARTQNGALAPELDQLARVVRRQTVEDLSCSKPELILIDNFDGTRTPDFDVVGFFEQDQDFRHIFSHYVREEARGRYTSFRKREDWAMLPGLQCRVIY